MITCRFQGAVDATEDSRASMPDVRALAVYWQGPHHFAAESRPEGLVAKADTEDRGSWCCFLDQREADAGLIRCAWSGRKHDGVRLQRHHIGNGNLVVAMHGDIRPKPSQIMEEVEGEAVVVVDEYDHVPPCFQGFTVALKRGQAARAAAVVTGRVWPCWQIGGPLPPPETGLSPC